jgi:hypothetical protein
MLASSTSPRKNQVKARRLAIVIVIERRDNVKLVLARNSFDGGTVQDRVFPRHRDGVHLILAEFMDLGKQRKSGPRREVEVGGGSEK